MTEIEQAFLNSLAQGPKHINRLMPTDRREMIDRFVDQGLVEIVGEEPNRIVVLKAHMDEARANS